jgi:hypothetical protein
MTDLDAGVRAFRDDQIAVAVRARAGLRHGVLDAAGVRRWMAEQRRRVDEGTFLMLVPFVAVTAWTPSNLS